MNHTAAKKYCKSLDDRAHLAEIRTPDILKFIERTVTFAPKITYVRLKLLLVMGRDRLDFKLKLNILSI